MAETYFELTQAQCRKRARLTDEEKKAVDVFLAAAKALPESLCISVDDDPDEPNLTISKRITQGSAMRVAWLKKRSLYF